MKDFARDETRFSLCGLNCLLCPMRTGGYCPGCGGGDGNQSCAIARCSLEHGAVPFCLECPSYPCGRYEDFDAADSFVPHRTRAEDAALARELGLDAYLARLEERRAALDALLGRYNDGRRKTMFHAAAYLLPIEELRAVLEVLESRPGRGEQPVKERALAAAALLQEAAKRRGVSLKLEKKGK